MIIICKDMGCFMLALFYLAIWWVIFIIKCDFLSEWEKICPTLSVFLYTSTCQLFSGVELKLIVSSIWKCKHLDSMVIICRDIGCFMLVLVYLENLMGDMQYKMWFSIRVRGGTLCHPQCFLYTPHFNFFLDLN